MAPGRSHKMFWKILLPIFLLPFAELSVLYLCWSSKSIGIPGTLVLVIGTGIVGVFLAKRQGVQCWYELHRQLDRNETPTLSVMHGLLILIAAFLLVVPGLITSLLGVLLLVPPIRSLVIVWLKVRFERYRTQMAKRNDEQAPQIIDVESSDPRM